MYFTLVFTNKEIKLGPSYINLNVFNYIFVWKHSQSAPQMLTQLRCGQEIHAHSHVGGIGVSCLPKHAGWKRPGEESS